MFVCVSVCLRRKISAIFPSTVQENKYRDLAGTGQSAEKKRHWILIPKWNFFNKCLPQISKNYDRKVKKKILRASRDKRLQVIRETKPQVDICCPQVKPPVARKGFHLFKLLTQWLHRIPRLFRPLPRLLW